MRAYTTPYLRNVGIAGHGDTGKTQLVSSLLFTAGMTPRLGKVAEGTTVTDWDEEEVARKISIQSSIAYAEWAQGGPDGKTAGEKIKINLIDTPGYGTFLNDTRATLIAADADLIVVDAAAGVQVVTEKVWDYSTEYEQPRAIVINRMDRELANFERALESVGTVLGRSVVPVQLPIGEEKQFRGLIDLVAMRALIYSPDGDGRAKEEEIPANMAEVAKEAHEKLVEMVAEGDDRADGRVLREGHAAGRGPQDGIAAGIPEPAADATSWLLRPCTTSAVTRCLTSSLIFSPILRRARLPADSAKPAARGSLSSARSRTPSRSRCLTSRRFRTLSPGESAISK